MLNNPATPLSTYTTGMQTREDNQREEDVILG